MSEVQVIRMQGGFGDAPMVAMLCGGTLIDALGEQVRREPGEALDAFETRCLARARGARMVVLGGLAA